tara:strand:+ start:113 stop:247 length:135 start_codon:yes stop_codon:yes gene_type:complete
MYYHYYLVERVHPLLERADRGAVVTEAHLVRVRARVRARWWPTW